MRHCLCFLISLPDDLVGFSVLQIDGSYGEGGGQILRTAVALSALTKKPVEITNIRARRPNPGIKPQHYIAIKSIKEICHAETHGLKIGSSRLTFLPGDLTGGNYTFDIGTAGSIPLVFQACLLSAIKTPEPVTIRVTGGTDVRWAPSWDYFQHVFLPLLQKMGVSIKAELVRRGYYPKGGGEAVITINPCRELTPLQLNQNQEFQEVNGIIHSAHLPDHIGVRMKHAAIQTVLRKNMKTPSVHIEKTTSLSAGVGITLWSQSEDTIIGHTVLGERGVSSEQIGETAAIRLLEEIEAGATLDVFAFDQLLPYMPLGRDNERSSCLVREISGHAATNMWLVQQFFDVAFDVHEQCGLMQVSVK
jgi:RNA 3'-phosphate cyclase